MNNKNLWLFDTLFKKHEDIFKYIESIILKVETWTLLIWNNDVFIELL